jgi:glutamyl-tRNA synthetase
VTVRVRFAPSPTGIPHVGNIRTALFNWLFARHEGGAFVLRIEDTDQARVVEGALEAILDGLRWLGLDWDEGPEVGGPHGPYFQSERIEHYRGAAQTLVKGGHAYECFCSPERLQAVRAEQQRRKQPPRYDRHCRDLSEEDRERRRDEGVAPVVRFKTPVAASTLLHDLIRGDVRFEHATLDDFVLVKSDGYPTYHLGNVVDDHLMEITHVLRGDDLFSSTPRHVLVYRALGWEPPLFAHLPLILGKDRSPLAKRHGAISAQEYRDEGFLPEALFNFLGLLGWSLDDRTTIISREQFIEHFSIDRVGKNPAVFDLDKLTWMNGAYIRDMSPERFTDLLAERLERDLPPEVPRPLDRAYVSRITPLVRERVRRLDEASEMTGFFFLEDGLEYAQSDLLGKAYAQRSEEALRALREAVERVSALPSWEGGFLEEVLRPLAAELGVKTGELFMLLRVAVTGRSVSPPLFESMAVLGRERCLSRLQSARELLEAGRG